MGTFMSIPGGANGNVHIYGNGTVHAGNGNDTIQIDGNGHVTVGAGNDHITVQGSASIVQHNFGAMTGSDTINLGRGGDTITEAGKATVYGSFGSATISGGKFEFLQVPSGSGYGSHADAEDGRGGSGHSVFEAVSLSGNATLVGGDHSTKFIAGSGSVVMQGGTGNDTFVGGSGHATMTGGSGQNLFDFGSHGNGGTDVITNFVAGQDTLYLEGQSLGYLQSHGDITVNNGNTYISLDGGHTTVELKGFTGLTSHDVASHKG
jgi:Ca2+-binding RTX toxin-like protein